ncbi:MAG TPA: hypothetical protein P5518_01215 [Candidatus Cloacimonas sp.]|nr:hypothetical protein [Candidatus Cloacimonas sp.]MDD2249969.1 hypothetical protein [Candidatus Cloacimonadota bacterium]MDD3733443.1 hypothetical protein [Candidatus Cloacimonadota bacterium]MDD3869175.1 hypothetical protein [Candidatus Cloacimonadota bacterium]HNV93062.1 hypothetical protein [Candidatus Cloacimonas sp.]
MEFSWISAKRCINIAIVGICKNAGKTTVLNYIVENYPHKWGILSTGRDGETEDTLYKTPKPKVKLPAGCLFCADAKTLVQQGSGISILAKTKWQSGGRELWIAKSEIDLETEITGPANVNGQIACAELFKKLGAAKVLIDGSLDRKSIVLSEAIDGIILAAGASFGSQQAIIDELQRLITLSQIGTYHSSTLKKLTEQNKILIKSQNRWKTTALVSLIANETKLLEFINEINNPTHLYIPGAYTSSVNNRLGKHLKGIQLVFRHPECIKLSNIELEVFLEDHKPLSLIPFKLKAIALNSHGVGSNEIDADEFHHNLRSVFNNYPLLDVMEI